MKTENKYYTPIKEELCIGFKYEVYSNGTHSFFEIVPTYEEGWYKHTIEYFDQMEDIMGLAKIYLTKEGDPIVRVKYLDTEDIEDLGFKKQDSPFDWIFIRDNFQLEYFPNIENSIIPTIAIYEKKYVGEEEYQYRNFYGKIKNKSELVQLLKQLEIDVN